jgi:hypothetical protein
MANPATSSGLQTSDAAIMNAAGRLLSIHLIADGTNAATVTIYDNASAASGLVLAKLAIPAGESYVDAHLPGEGVVANNGIYADVSGTGAAYIVGYSLG